jgi:hypothetical protein
MAATNKPYQLGSMGNAEVHIGTISLQTIRDIHKKTKEVDLCPEAAFMKNDKEKLYGVIVGTVTDIVESKRGRGRPLGSKNKGDKNEKGNKTA